ncbi:MAG: DUF2505 domain-containing protein [Candidatus Nanopelagicales bacterium]|nr:DUF2505 domain-containing protein [Candidatus Nanopelagicales bacterium]
MATQINDVRRYDAPAPNVFSMLSDVEFIELKCRRSGSIEVSAHVETDGDGMIIVSRRVLPAKIPAFARSMVGETITLIETQKWGPPDAEGSRAATFHADFGKAPIAFNGDLSLTAEDASASLTTTGMIKASVPLLSRKIESIALDWTQRYLRKESEVGSEWLKAGGPPPQDD